MRIAYFTHYFPPETNAPAARVYEQARALVRRGHQVHVVTGQPNHPRGLVYDGYRALSYREEVLDEIIVHRCPMYPAANRGVVRRSAAFLALPASQLVLAPWCVPDIDLVLATSPQILTGVAGVGFARMRRVPFFLEVRDLWPESIVAVGALPATHPVVRALERLEHHLYNAARGVVVTAESFIRHLEHHGVARSNVALVPNGVDTRLFSPERAPAAIRERLGIPANAFVVLFCGVIGLAHDVGLLARAIARMRSDEVERDNDMPVHAVIVGDGADRHNVASEIHGLHVEDRVHLLEPVPRDHVPGLLAAADASIVLLRDHATFRGVLPSKMFEAMAMRRPIVLGVEGEAKALVERAGAGLPFRPGDAGDLVRCIRCLVQIGAAARERLGQNGAAYVAEHHDRDKLGHTLERFLITRCHTAP